jgi:hypothetical protein
MTNHILMKSRIVSAIFLFVLVASTSNLSAGVFPITKTVPVKSFNSCFGSFNAHRQGKGITLTWTTAIPADIEAFEVERSVDGEFYDVVASSDCNNNTRFKWTDESVFPGYSYYRIAAYKKDGSVEYSVTQVVRIVSRK